jgi:predicted lipoprotein with Yx(FWY)xxD motif
MEAQAIVERSSNVRRSMNRKSMLIYGAVALFVLFVALSSIGAFSHTATPKGTEVSVLTTARYGSVLVAGRSNHLLNHFPLYEFSGDRAGHLGCGTAKTKGYDLGANVTVALTCTGPQSDLLNDVSSDDWPALTSKTRPVAGPGVNPKLLGRIYRRGIGYQITYGGHPLYLFDQSSKPFKPQGEGYVETVSPLPPWHGFWFLVNAVSGAPASNVATIEPGTLPNGNKVMSVVMDEDVASSLITVYHSSNATPVTSCDAQCGVDWIPVYSSAVPIVHGFDATLFGLRRVANGASAVTYRGSVLYVDANEKVLFASSGKVERGGTSGNGEGESGPGGTMLTIGVSS